jgi:hypothetical protein
MSFLRGNYSSIYCRYRTYDNTSRKYSLDNSLLWKPHVAKFSGWDDWANVCRDVQAGVLVVGSGFDAGFLLSILLALAVALQTFCVLHLAILSLTCSCCI